MSNWAQRNANSIDEAERDELLRQARLTEGAPKLFKATRQYVSDQCARMKEAHGKNLVVAEVCGENEVNARAINKGRLAHAEFNKKDLVTLALKPGGETSTFLIEVHDNSALYRSGDGNLYDAEGLGDLILDAAMGVTT